MQFNDYFGAYDTLGNQHTGFLQSMDFSALTQDIPFLNELTMSIIDAHLYNELSGSLVMRQWAKYMHYSKANARMEIYAQFYTDFVNALAAKLYDKQAWVDLKNIDFTSLSATDIKTIEHGTKETEKDFAQKQRTNLYGTDETTNVYGSQQDTNLHGETLTTNIYGQQQDTHLKGQVSTDHTFAPTETSTEYDTLEVTKDYDNVKVTVSHDGNDTHTVGAAHTTSSTTAQHKIFPLGGADYVNDTFDGTDVNNNSDQQINTDSFADVETDTDGRQDKETTATHTDKVSTIQRIDNDTTAQHTDTDTMGEHTDTERVATHTDTLTRATHTDTSTRANHTDTLTDAAHKDTEKIKAYTDTERHTKHIIIAPDKYFEIEKELAELNVYNLMADAVRETMLLSIWEGDDFIW